MALNSLAHVVGNIEDFSPDCQIQAFVPLNPLEQELGDNSLLENIRTSDDDLLSRIPQRRVFLADEIFDLYVELRVPLDSEKAIHRILSQLSISVATYIQDGRDRLGFDADIAYTTQEVPNKCIFSSIVTNEDQIRLLTMKEVVYVYWKKTCHLDLPRNVYRNFLVYFVTTVTRTTLASLTYPDKAEEYLRSGTPLPSNVLQLLSHDPAFKNTRPYMSASRFTKNTPSMSGNKTSQKPLVSVMSKLHPALPALNTQFRVISHSRSGIKQIMLLSVEITTSQVLNVEVKLVEVDLSLRSGVLRQKTQPVSAKQPLKLKPGEQFSLVYEITLTDTNNEDTNNFPITRICTSNIVALIDIPAECTIRISLDCSESMCDVLRRAVSELSLRKNPDTLIRNDIQYQNDQANPTLFHLSHDQGIAISISGPQKVRIGKAFVWKMLIVNKTLATRKFTVTLVPDIIKNGNDERLFESRPILSQTHEEMTAHRTAQSSMVAFNLVKSQRNSMAKRTDILCLSPHIRVDPLQPLGCFATKLDLLPLQLGQCHVGALRITDELSKEIGMIEVLPDIIAIQST